MKPFVSSGLLVAAFAIAPHAQAQDRYQISAAERAACQGDAVRLCSSAYPNEDAMLACMKTNQAQLTTSCRPVFIAGLHRRGL